MSKKKTVKFEQYFTPDKDALKLTQSVVERYDPSRSRWYIEPSVGEGAFLHALLECGVPRRHIKTVDIDPNMNPDVCCDFLQWVPTVKRDYLVLGNPPFGKQGSTAWKFKDHALTFAPVCCLVMPISTSKREGGFSLQMGISFEHTKVQCCWTEFHNTSLPALRCGRPSLDISGIQFVTKDDDYDIVIQRCGAGLGKVTQCNGTGQGKYYIKATPNVVKALRSISDYLEHAPEAFITSHQPSLNRDLVMRLTQISFFYQNCG